METLQTVIQLMNQLGKQPLLTQEQPGLFTSRILLTYLSSFCNLASEGVSVSYIDNLMEQEFGWAKGPGKLIDIIGVNVVYRAIQNLNKNYPDRIYVSENNLLASLNHQSLTGIKSLSGFYQYKKDATEKHHTIGLSSAVKNFLSQPNKKITAKEIIYRLMLPMMNEVVRCLEEEVISTPEEGDFALVHGIGFPAFRGGVFHQIDQLTLPSYLAIISQYKKYGAAYHPPALLLYMQEKALHFYPTSISAHSV
jgi:3-hydroxyacyl-CoA dehydrogenase/enoyl-CoA hydratase/3-hydroxybutyryl-CoA epimerase/enoyl-CoA isomerase